MNSILFDDGGLRLTFCAGTGRLTGIAAASHSLPMDSLLWRLRVKHGDAAETVTLADLPDFRHRREEDALTLYWSDHRFEVRVVLRAVEGKTQWRVQALCKSDAYSLWEVVFPIIECPFISEGGINDFLVLPWQNGWLIRDPVHTLLDSKAPMPFWLGRGGGKYENEYPAQYSFQFAALYSPEHYGVYFSTEDGDVHIKTMGFYERDNGFDFAVTHYPEHMGQTRYFALSYPFVLHLYEGSWTQAVSYYREWALGQKWCRDELRDRDIPESLRRIDLWRINHTNSPLGMQTQQYFDESVLLGEKLDCTLGLHWYGWNMAPHGYQYAEYISREQREKGWPQALARWNERFDREGIYRIPYVNARLWDMNIPSWTRENAQDAALRDENMQLCVEPWRGEEIRPMCPATAKWQDKVMDFCLEAIKELGFDGLYLDQVASYYALLCFDPAHPHPTGGGTWWNDAYHAMIGTLRNLIGKDKILTTESCCESYIDCFDVFLILDTNMQESAFAAVAGGENCESLPLFAMIYGGRALSYGSVCQFSDPPDVFEFNFIRNILWGFMPTVEGAQLSELLSPDAHVYLDVLKKGVDFYRKNRDLIWHGTLKRIPQVSCESIELAWTVDGRPYVKEYPAVLAVVREDPENGQDLYMMYNLHGSRQTATIDGRTVVIEPHSFLIMNCGQ